MQEQKENFRTQINVGCVLLWWRNYMEELKIEYIDISKLNHYENNSKIHTKEQIEHIANSIKEFGFNDPQKRNSNFIHLDNKWIYKNPERSKERI